jgi:hypothetical protein
MEEGVADVAYPLATIMADLAGPLAEREQRLAGFASTQDRLATLPGLSWQPYQQRHRRMPAAGKAFARDDPNSDYSMV